MTDFTTADLYDAFPDLATPLCLPFRSYGKTQKFFGQIRTVRCPNDNSMVRKTLQTNGSNQVLVIDAASSREFAFLGDQLAKLALTNRWSGIVVNGCVRDSAILETLDIGIFALGTCPRKTSKNNLGEIDVNLIIDKIQVLPKHYLYADSDGVILSSKALI